MFKLRNIAWVLAASAALCLHGQTSPDTYWVPFTDKENTPFSLDQPEQFLSARAIQRRTTQGIGYDQLDLPVDPAYITAVLNTGEVDLLNQSKWFNGITIRTTDLDALSAIQSLGFVNALQPTGVSMAGQSRQPKFLELAPVLDRDGEPELYGTAFRQIEMLNGHQLHAIQAKGQGMLIGVLDSGFLGVDSAIAFQSLRDRDGIVLTRDLVRHDGDVFDDHYHGRSVLSCMAADLDGVILGTAPGADYVLIRTENAESEYPVEEDNWIAGAELADSIGCDVLNTSLGYTTFDDSTMDHTYAQLDGQTLRISIAARIAVQKGMIPVHSAGNSGTSEWRYIGAPADAIDILAVGAVGDVENSAPWSSRGPSADGRVKPDVCAMGWGSIVLRENVDSIVAANGTSFASPILAGLVACLWQLHPNNTAPEVMTAVRQSASFYTAPSDSLGYGVPDFALAHTILLATSIRSTTDQGTLHMYPLPFTDQLNIAFRDPVAGPLQLTLLDLAGRTVWSGSQAPTGNRLQVGGLGEMAEGLYVLQLTDQQGTVLTRSVIKAR
ncbi:MAG TPA: S8 family serine peptidase [Flavobacteriales bacterium]|nr:S8 family serine peptidase [Flavobacteriales bacterium]HQV74971.1 S8 family serine peptidase [Flavobacteriales bacterium]HQW41499.1 S8 family serine peptidase [Flavobacteriales bacterium]